MNRNISDWINLGAAIRDARRGRSLSQEGLARLAGVSRSWLARLESGHRGAELEQIFRVLGALDLTLVLSDGGRPRQSAAGASDVSDTAADIRRRRWDEATADYLRLTKPQGDQGASHGV